MPVGAGGSANEHYSTLTFHIDLPAVGTSATTVFNGALGYRYRLVSGIPKAVVAGTGAGATRAFTVVRFRGGVGTAVAAFTPTLANTAFAGTIPFTLTAGLADYDFEDGDEIRVNAAAGGTVFTAGQLNLILTIASRGQRRN